MEQSNSVVLRQVFEAFAKGDIPTVLGAMDANIVWEEPDAPGHPWGGTTRGPNGVLNGVFMPIGGNFEQFEVKADELIDYGNRVFAVGHVDAKARATGKTFVMPFVFIVSFEDNKITRFQVYENAAMIIEALK